MYLLDTQIVLWSLFEPHRLSRSTTALLSRPERLTVSVVTFFEAAVKSAVGKLRAPDDLPEQVERTGVTILPVSTRHAWGVRDLPPIHRDPFDRLLISQVLAEGLTMISADHVMDRYPIPLVRA